MRRASFSRKRNIMIWPMMMTPARPRPIQAAAGRAGHDDGATFSMCQAQQSNNMNRSFVRASARKWARYLAGWRAGGRIAAL